MIEVSCVASQTEERVTLEVYVEELNAGRRYRPGIGRIHLQGLPSPA